jgi:hypothetical protein
MFEGCGLCADLIASVMQKLSAAGSAGEMKGGWHIGCRAESGVIKHCQILLHRPARCLRR